MLNGQVVLIAAPPPAWAGHDVRDEKSVESFIRDVMSVTKRIDVLINNAGHGPGAKPRSPRNWRDES